MLPDLMLTAVDGVAEVFDCGAAPESSCAALVFFDRRDAWLRGDTS
jgi:hypothetical protein